MSRWNRPKLWISVALALALAPLAACGDDGDADDDDDDDVVTPDASAEVEVDAASTDVDAGGGACAGHGSGTLEGTVADAVLENPLAASVRLFPDVGVGMWAIQVAEDGYFCTDPLDAPEPVPADGYQNITLAMSGVPATGNYEIILFEDPPPRGQAWAEVGLGFTAAHGVSGSVEITSIEDGCVVGAFTTTFGNPGDFFPTADQDSGTVSGTFVAPLCP